MNDDQHFMVDEALLATIAQFAKDRVVTEIGGGTGNLTKNLIAHSKKLHVIEQDPNLAEQLRKKFPTAVILEGDAQTLPLQGTIIGNIPYRISEQIFYRIMREARQECILTVGMNFAELLQNKRTKLGIYTELFFTFEQIAAISPESFDPAPSVWSACIVLTPKHPTSLLTQILRQTDKKLKNAIIEALCSTGKKQKEAKKIEESLGISLREKKIQQMSNIEFIKVYEELVQQLPQYDVSEERDHR